MNPRPPSDFMNINFKNDLLLQNTRLEDIYFSKLMTCISSFDNSYRNKQVIKLAEGFASTLRSIVQLIREVFTMCDRDG